MKYQHDRLRPTERCLLTADLIFSRNVKQKQGVDYTYDDVLMLT